MIPWAMKEAMSFYRKRQSFKKSSQSHRYSFAFGGDEFTIIIPDLASSENLSFDLSVIANKVLQA